MWQFLKWRNEYGLQQTRYTTTAWILKRHARRRHHLRDLYRSSATGTCHGRVRLRAGGVKKAVERTGYADFWELRSRELYRPDHQLRSRHPRHDHHEKNAAEYGLDGIQLDPRSHSTRWRRPRPPACAGFRHHRYAGRRDAALNPAILKGLFRRLSAGVPKAAATSSWPRCSSFPEHPIPACTSCGAANAAAIGKRYAALPGSIAAANHLSSAQARMATCC